MDKVYDRLTDRAIAAHTTRTTTSPKKKGTRTIIAIAGPPGSGKSTVAHEVALRLNASTRGPSIISAVVVPMDGFHLSRAHLDSLPNKEEVYRRRGIHWTFDGAGIVEAVKKMADPERRGILLLPSFDHAKKDPMADEVMIEASTDILILEGSWLLFDEAPWNEISKMVHESWFVNVHPDLARDRIARRHILSTIEKTWEDAVKRAEMSDLPNGDEIRRHLIKPDMTVESIQETPAR
jgi:pantothenate kinase